MFEQDWTLKEPLVLEFLGLEAQPRFSENDLETAILNHIEHFLLEFNHEEPQLLIMCRGVTCGSLKKSLLHQAFTGAL